MKISVRIAIMSHLSDAQELMSVGAKDLANRHINFAKRLIIMYDDTRVEMTTEELNEIWKTIKE